MALRRIIRVGMSQGLINRRQALAVFGDSRRSKALPHRSVTTQVVRVEVTSSPAVARRRECLHGIASAISIVLSGAGCWANALSSASPIRCRASRLAPLTESKLRKP
ncbi:hypothetical protein D9M71_611720 [compost metagenome]